jgi:uncharacterized protein YbcC (UPF0753/DUF2309 family)
MITASDTENKSGRRGSTDRRDGGSHDPLAAALKLSVPAWPLQNAVAVNPFWHRQGQSFAVTMEELASVLHARLYMPLEYYLEKYRRGVITPSALEAALRSAQSRYASVPDTLDDLLRASAVEPDTTRHALTFAEAYDRVAGTHWQRSITEQASKYAAAYFDDGQAALRFPWRHLSFWQGWSTAQAHDRAMEVLGAVGFRDIMGRSASQSARDFVEMALVQLGLRDGPARAQYLSRLLATGLGWSTQFSYCQWQRALGYDETPVADPVDHLAVLLAYDFGLAQSLGGSVPGTIERWRESLRHPGADDAQVHGYQLHEVWQAAAEASYQDSVAAQIGRPATPSQPPRAQIVMCIDVRSELLRRSIERAAPEVASIGFAGFFGMPVDYERADEARAGHRLPVLLSPAFRVREAMPAAKAKRLETEVAVRSFFRNLRKAPLGSFFYVELMGVYAAVKLLRRSLASLLPPSGATRLPARLDGRNVSLQPVGLDLQAKVERAAAVLRHMGLTRDFARIVVLAGHGSVSTNNAFASTLDCGACGGHAGDVNARLLAEILNDPAVRQGLVAKGIEITSATWFVAALHETVSDRLHMIGGEHAPPSHAADVARLVSDVARASDEARRERQVARSRYLDRSPERRMSNWSEVRPEWGLAGNACFIIAPRAWTMRANLDSRAFLHDYDATHDDGYATLEMIMTAPMIVTNWINLQYYASTVAPQVYGAGDKTLHNLVNECGTQEGNGGDLRVGLPLQSVHDGEAFVHEPLRLSVFIAAPRDAIEMIVGKHAVVKRLVDNQWLHVLQIDVTTGVVARRLPGGLYVPLAPMV